VGEANTGDVLGVTSQRSRLSTFSGRVSVDLDETVVITSGDEHTVLGTADTIDVSAVSTAGEDTLNIPRELGGLGGPSHTSGVASARWVVGAVVHLEEEKLVSTTVGADVRTVNSPVKVSDVGFVSLKGSTLSVAILNIVDVDVVVVGTNSKLFTIRRVAQDFDPFGGVLKAVLLITTATVLDHKSTIVTSNSEVITADGNSSRALRVGQLGKSGGTTSLGLLLSVSNLEGLLSASLGRIPSDDLVIISRGVDATLRVEIETPNLTVVVRVHDFLVVYACNVAVNNGTTSQTDNQTQWAHVDGADEATEFDGSFESKVRGSGQDDATIFTTRVQGTVVPFHGADEALFVSLEGTNAAAVLPLIDKRIGTTRVALFLVIPSTTRHGGHLVGAKETLLLLRCVISIPEVHMLDTSGGESFRAGSKVPLEVKDFVGTTLVGHNKRAI